jgi:two-component system response regulator RegA
LQVVVLAGYASVATTVEALKQGLLSVQRVEWEYIQRQLVANNNNVAATARALGMHRRTLQRKLQKRPGKY